MLDFKFVHHFLPITLLFVAKGRRKTAEISGCKFGKTDKLPYCWFNLTLDKRT